MQGIPNNSRKQSFSLTLQPQAAWMAILGLLMITTLCLVAGLGKVLNLIFPAGSLAVGLFLYLRYPILYVGFTWWVFFLTPFIRRVSDLRSGFTDPSPMLLAPPLVAMITVVTLYRNLPKASKQGGLPFILSAMGVFYGFLVGMINGSPVPAIVSLMTWVSPILFSFHLFVNWRDYPSYRQNIQRAFLWCVLITASYGVYQYLVAPEWDCFWLIQTKLYTSMGKPEPQGLRVWSTMNAPLQFAVVMIAGNILLFIGKGPLRGPGLAVGILSVLLTSVRTAWGGFLVALITLITSLKGTFQMRLIALIVTIFICILPLSTVEPFSKVIQSRVTSLSNVKDDQSAKDRAELYGRTLNLALGEVIGKGNGTLQPIDSGIIELLLTLGWMGAIPYVGGIILSFYSLFQGTKPRSDPFASAARAIVIGFLPMLAGSNVIVGISGMVFWGFLGMGMAAKKHYQYQQISGLK
ncbi:MAG: O-antigen ligase domain-containing protein [Microcoleus sp. CSU_2_2]|nr:O-antigen ligase domain-containing protein [Microcoleus sp. SU_5_3]NJS12495.1 O-antigen ligase domain-containing protein [Microcoleus sp. CSU_2_2]